MVKVIETAELGKSWFANANDDGTFTIRNCDLGQRIDLSAAEAMRFCAFWDAATTTNAARRAETVQRMDHWRKVDAILAVMGGPPSTLGEIKDTYGVDALTAAAAIQSERDYRRALAEEQEAEANG